MNWPKYRNFCWCQPNCTSIESFNFSIFSFYLVYPTFTTKFTVWVHSVDQINGLKNAIMYKTASKKQPKTPSHFTLKGVVFLHQVLNNW